MCRHIIILYLNVFGPKFLARIDRNISHATSLPQRHYIYYYIIIMLGITYSVRTVIVYYTTRDVRTTPRHRWNPIKCITLWSFSARSDTYSRFRPLEIFSKNLFSDTAMLD